MYAPDRGSGSEGGRNARYAYLVARLRNRQMTMEEATELFTLMQGMLQTSEAARAALIRAPAPPPSTIRPPAAARPAAPPIAINDDLLLVGLLAMGAGTGLLAAITKRLREGAPVPNSTPTGRSGPDTPSLKG